jgi:signal transduction histidine kinase
VVIYASEAGIIGKTLTNHPVSEPAGNGEVGALRTRSLNGQDIVAGYAPVPRTDWTLIVEERWSELIRPTLRYQQFLLFLLALGVIIPTTVVMIGVRRITRPLADFIAAAQRIAGGDFNQRIQVATGDEMEELADQFNTMTRRLHDSYETLEQRVLQRTHELTALNSIAAIVSRSLDLEQILPDALTKTIEVMGMDAGAVFRLDSETGLLTLVTQQGLSPEFIALIEKFPVGTSLTSVTVQSKYPAARLVANYPPGALKDRLAEGGWKTAVSIPLLAQEHVLGAINATSRNEIEFSPEELAVPAAIGQQIGIAMDNARLYEQSVSYARQMEIERHAAVDARAAAERASAAKSDFLANVSHELRTPLFSINGFAHLVKKRLHERIFPYLNGEDSRQERTMAQINENLDIILVEGQRLTTMINSLLDLAKIESGNMEWEIRKFALATVIRQAAASTDALFENSSLSLTLDLPDPLPPVTGDPEKTLQVLINLISNAVKFSLRGTVTIRACQKGDEIVTSVSDQGIGIDPAYYDEIFQKFTQVGETLTGKPKGTGLGLAISRQIIERQGGHIWVDSEPGRGSTFSFSLPVSDWEGDEFEI